MAASNGRLMQMFRDFSQEVTLTNTRGQHSLREYNYIYLFSSESLEPTVVLALSCHSADTILVS
jgi:hypothetical protein